MHSLIFQIPVKILIVYLIQKKSKTTKDTINFDQIIFLTPAHNPAAILMNFLDIVNQEKILVALAALATLAEIRAFYLE